MKSVNPRHIWLANRDRMFKGLEQRQADEEKSRAKALQAQDPTLSWGEALKRATSGNWSPVKE